MTISWRRPALAAVFALTATVGAVLVAAPAQAQAVASGSFSFSGDPGDWISGGGSYSYSTSNGDTMNVSGSASTVSISVDGANGDWWYLYFDAPDGQTLSPGTTFTDATRYPFNGSGAGLSRSGNGRGCNTLTGSFTIINSVFGPNGYVQTFDATFEQHCEGGDPAARGEVHIANSPPPPALELGLVVAADGTADTLNGNAILHGTVSCTKSTTVYVYGTITQVDKALLARGSFSAQVACTPGDPLPWTATASPSGPVAFVKGEAQVTAEGRGYDVDYGTNVVVSTTTTVKLDKLKP